MIRQAFCHLHSACGERTVMAPVSESGSVHYG